MRKSERWTNAVLVLLVAVLALICARSIVAEQKSEAQRQEISDGRNNE